jgi:hypothetical protein
VLSSKRLFLHNCVYQHGQFVRMHMLMAMQFSDELQAEAPPSKRARLEQSENMQGATMDVTEDNHHIAASLTALEASNAPRIELPKTVAVESPTLSMKGIPGLGLLGQAPTADRRSTSRGKSSMIYSSKVDRLTEYLSQNMNPKMPSLIQSTVHKAP